MASVRFTAVLEPAEEGGFVVKCVELPVATEGETKKEALANLKEAIEGYLEVKAERLREQTKGERVELILSSTEVGSLRSPSYGHRRSIYRY
jgi:predicted RNase H-like HicB family nuclease